MKRRWTRYSRAAAVLCALSMSACGAFHRTAGTLYDDPSAIAVLSPTQGSSVHGAVTFLRANGLARINVNMGGFKPGTTHGLHIHDRGDCTARDGSSAGEHFNPTSAQHGGPHTAPRHGGDLGNITANSQGNVYAFIDVGEIAFGTGSDSIIGRGLVVHAERDDLTSQPAGNSGARIACGMITRNPDRMSHADVVTTAAAPRLTLGPAP